jgi:hypothetical protein
MTFPGTIMRITTNAVVSPRSRWSPYAPRSEGSRRSLVLSYCADSLPGRLSLAVKSRVRRSILRVVPPKVGPGRVAVTAIAAGVLAHTSA